MENWDPNHGGIFTWLFSSANNILNQYIIDTSRNVMSAIHPVAFKLFSISVLLWGIAHICNKIEEPVTDGAMRLIKIGIILGIALNIVYYQQYAVNFAIKAPMTFAALATGDSNMSGKGSVSPGEMLDKSLDRGFQVGNKVWDKGGWTAMGYYIVAILIWVAIALILLFAAFLIMLSKVALVVLLSVGPVFIMLLLFQATQRFFEVWLGQVVNFMVTMILAVLVTDLIIKIIDGFFKGMLNPKLSLYPPAPGKVLLDAVVIGGIGILVLCQVPTIASAISGGIGVSTLGAFRGAANAAGSAGRGAWNKATRKDVRAEARRQRIEASGTQYNKTRDAAKERLAKAFRRKASGGDSVGKA